MNTVARSTQGLSFGSALEVVPLAKRRSGVAASLAVVLVLPLGLNGGGYDGRSFTPLTLAFGAAAALAFLAWTVRLPRALVATVLALTALAGWVALSSVWARDGSFVELETRRCIVYAVALLAVGAVVDRGSRRAFLTSTAFAIVGLAVVAVVTRAYSGVPVDPFYGGLLAEPVGYPNAMGVLAAVGAVLAIGLGATGQDPTARALRAAAPFLVVVLGATGSRGGALALGMGLAVLIGLSDRSARWSCGGCAATSLVVGGGAWGLAAAAGGGGATFVIVAVCSAAIGAAAPPLGRRAIYAVACGLAIAAGAAVAIKPPATTSSYRTDYWAAALTELSERPFLGSGAGSFHLTWLERRTLDARVRDAHSLYVETLSELGPVGLALVLALVGVPLAVALGGRRHDPLGATAAAGFATFAVHAGVDWDWEMPVVTLVSLGCAGALLASDRSAHTSNRRDEGGRDGRLHPK